MLYYLPIGKLTISGNFEDITLPTGDGQTAASPTPTPGTPAQNGAASGDTSKNVTTQLKITLTPDVEADERAGVYYATPHANYMYEDDVQVKVNSKHLLDTGNVKTEDKTVAIVQEVTSLASQIATAGAKMRAPPRQQNRRPFNFTFRPSVYSEYDDVRTKLADRGITLTVDPAPMPDGKAVVIEQNEAKQLGANGLLFRPAVAYNVRVSFSDILATRQQFVLPDQNRIYEIGYPRISFIKREKNIGFSDGMLTDFHQITPSPILGFLGLPKAIIKGVVPLPGS